MKLKSIYIAFISILVVFFVSCLGNGSDTELSSDPHFISLTFLSNDSIPGLSGAVFTLEHDASVEGDSIIVNLDSLPFQTRLDSVWPVFYFKSTYITRLFQETEEGIDTVYLAGNSSTTKNDTIDFTIPTKVQNFSADGTAERTYPVKVNVHQVRPELYVWDRLQNQITANSSVNQKAVFFNNQFLFYIGSETGNSLYTAEETNLSANWQKKATLEFPENRTSLKLRYMVKNEDVLYVTDNESQLYKSGNGVEWEKVDYNLTDGKIHNLLFSMNDALWAITQSNDGNEYRMAHSADGVNWADWGVLPEKNDSRKFPVSNYSALVFRSAVGRPKAIVVGGYSESGTLIPVNWIGQVDVNNKMIWEPLRQNTLPAIQDAAVIQYDNKLLLFGGLQSNGNIIALQESRNEGLTWHTPDSTSNVLPENFPMRSSQSVDVNEASKRIYIVGGKDNTKTYSDVWTGKLNRLGFQ